MLSGKKHRNKPVNPFYKRSGIYLICIVVLFVSIGLLTTVKPAYRFSSQAITKWTSDIDSSTFLYLIGMENRAFKQAFPEDKQLPKLTTTIFQIATSLKPNDPRSLLGHEIPGFSIFDSHMLIAGEGTDYTNLPVESSPPLEDVLKDREAIVDKDGGDDGDKNKEKKKEKKDTRTTGKRDVVFLYNSHSRESFLPHLPGVTNPDEAHHKEVNVTKVSDRLAEKLKENGIGTNVDHTDIMNLLNEKGWGYGQSYKASRGVVEEALATNKDIQYAFDLHRDSIGRDKTTKKIDGKDFARIMIVVGEDYDDYEKNLELATELHYLLEEKYPGLSRGVYPKKGAGTNGVFNQDLTENGLLFEIGGVGNNLDELYRSADALGDVFSEFYWDAEKVNADK
jgi:stage II sporulation protein P